MEVIREKKREITMQNQRNKYETQKKGTGRANETKGTHQ